jgi:hypothetical protein
VPAKTPHEAAATTSVDWGRLRGERKRRRPELDAGRAIAAANLASPLACRRRQVRGEGRGREEFSFAVAGGPKWTSRDAGGPKRGESVKPS